MNVYLTRRGPVAQLGARMNGIHEVTGSIPVWSTNPNRFFRSDASTVLSGNEITSCRRVRVARTITETTGRRALERERFSQASPERTSP
jgi:hypothetical protein